MLYFLYLYFIYICFKDKFKVSYILFRSTSALRLPYSDLPMLVCRPNCTRNMEQITNESACVFCKQGERGNIGPEGSQGAIGERVTLKILSRYKAYEAWT